MGWVAQLLKTKDTVKFLKAAIGGKKPCRTKRRMTVHCSTERMQCRRKWNIINALTEKNCPHGILYKVKVSSKNEGKMKNFSDTQKLKKFIANIPYYDDVEDRPQAGVW